MDVFSDALNVLRTGDPVCTCTDVRAPWSLHFPAIAGAGSSDPALTADDFTYDRIDRSSYIGRITVDGPGERCVLACGAYKLDVTRRHPLLAGLPGVIHLPAGPAQYPALRTTVAQLTEEMDEPRPGSDSVVAALIDLMLLQIIRAWYDALPRDHARGWAAAITDPVIAPALQGIHNEPGRAWTVDSLAHGSGLSRAAFARRFTAVVGEPPLSYLTRWRMTAAGRLLRQTDDPLATLAARSGYGSEFAFAMAFKREYGIAPGSYRRQARRPPDNEQPHRPELHPRHPRRSHRVPGPGRGPAPGCLTARAVWAQVRTVDQQVVIIGAGPAGALAGQHGTRRATKLPARMVARVPVVKWNGTL